MPVTASTGVLRQPVPAPTDVPKTIDKAISVADDESFKILREPSAMKQLQNFG